MILLSGRDRTHGETPEVPLNVSRSEPKGNYEKVMVGLSLICLVLLVATNWGAHNLIVGVLKQWRNYNVHL